MTTASRKLRLATLFLVSGFLALGAASCKTGGGIGLGGGSAQLTLTVNPPDAQNRRAASVQVAPDGPLSAAQLTFELPEGCRIVAGAAVRSLGDVAPGKSVTQELAFECPAGTAGSIKVTLAGKNASGKDITSSVDAKL